MLLAECKTEAQIGRRGSSTAAFSSSSRGSSISATAAMAKYWVTETECRIVDRCVQLHGGYGYVSEYLIARMWPTAAWEDLRRGERNS